MRFSLILHFRSFMAALLGFLLSCGGCANSLRQGRAATAAGLPPQPQPIHTLSANDVSWLFPPPIQAADFDKLIAVGDLTTPNREDPTKRDPVWPDAAFQQFLAIAASSAGHVAGTPSQIGLPAEAQSIDAWFISGVRIDAGAPGLSNEIREEFGQSPQIRLILQPVIHNPDGTPRVLDIAGHLVFDFTMKKPKGPAQAGCLPRPQADMEAFNGIVEDLIALRTSLSDGKLGTDKVATSGVPLGIHPGLADATTQQNVRQEMKEFLERHISAERLDSMAIEGLPAGAPAPWIFLSMVRVPSGAVPALPNGGFVPVHGPTLDGQQFAQMLEPAGQQPRVVPAPHTNNLNPITCRNAAAPADVSIAQRRGVATADVFGNSAPQTEHIKKVLDTIADPTRSHFFNTDCVSCHTETRRAMESLNVTNVPGVDPAVLPIGPWDVRNFGWALSAKGPAQPTVTRRTAAETAAVVALINSELIAKQKH